LTPVFQRKTTKKVVQAYRKGLGDEGLADLWDGETEESIEAIYQGLLACEEDDLYLQEFLPFGAVYRVAGKHGVHRRNTKVSIDKVMQEHIMLRDVFWEFRRARSEKVHDFAVEKRMCQCFNSLLQATVQAYQTSEPTLDVLDPLRDPLTGVFNNLYFMTRLEEEVKRSERYLRDVTVVLFHIDSGFDLGSAEDNELMRAIARVLRRNSRASDILARVEEAKFAILMPETRSEDADRASHRLRDQLGEYIQELGDSFTEVNVEVGLASYPEHGDDSAVLLEEAEESLRREAGGGF